MKDPLHLRAYFPDFLVQLKILSVCKLIRQLMCFFPPPHYLVVNHWLFTKHNYITQTFRIGRFIVNSTH